MRIVGNGPVISEAGDFNVVVVKVMGQAFMMKMLAFWYFGWETLVFAIPSKFSACQVPDVGMGVDLNAVLMRN